MDRQVAIDMVRNMGNFVCAETKEDFNKFYRPFSKFVEENIQSIYDNDLLCDVCKGQAKLYIDAGKPEGMVNAYVPKIGEDVGAMINTYVMFGPNGRRPDPDKMSDAEVGEIVDVLMTDLKKVREDSFEYAKKFFSGNDFLRA